MKIDFQTCSCCYLSKTPVSESLSAVCGLPSAVAYLSLEGEHLSQLHPSPVTGETSTEWSALIDTHLNYCEHMLHLILSVTHLLSNCFRMTVSSDMPLYDTPAASDTPATTFTRGYRSLTALKMSCNRLAS